MMEIALVALVQIGVLLCSQVCRWCGLSQAFTRKVAHALGGVSAALLPLLVSVEAAVTTGLIGIFTLAWFQQRGYLTAVAEQGKLDWGVVTFPVGLVLSAVLFWWWLEAETAFQFAVAVMGVCDAVAGYTGARFGRTPFGYRGRKTVFGSLACAVSALIILGVISVLDVLPVSFAAFLLIPLLSAATEAYSPRWLDNVSLPLVAGLAFWWLG